MADTPTVSPIPGLPLTSPEKEGFSSERLAVIGNVMQKYIDNRMIPGSLTVIARHGKIVHHQCRGFMDIEAEKPVADDTIFRLASMTKPFTCFIQKYGRQGKTRLYRTGSPGNHLP